MFAHKHTNIGVEKTHEYRAIFVTLDVFAAQSLSCSAKSEQDKLFMNVL